MSRLFRFIVSTVFVLLCGLQAAMAAVNANTASADELQTVRGIGPTIAQRIVQERAKGPYKSLDDLQARVKGVGSNSIRKMAEGGLTVSGGTSRAAKASGKAAGDAGSGKPVASPAKAPATATAGPATAPTASAPAAPAPASTSAAPASARADTGSKPAAAKAGNTPTDKPTDTARKP